jgi:hypothetical protein
MPGSTLSDVLEPRPEAVIAGTLSLMSCYVQHPVALYAERVVANLDLMARLPGLSPELRTICRRLAQRWETIQDEARRRRDAGERAIDVRTVH